ncbi:hypothetical protein F8M41_023873 [Gigaspora margarita]|uniref:Uncharacterized protein n=1 Tax=Gigaspora margarita TaxID=4874 RepID=A0A8H4ACM8_GIGMA|nr:hypothetical protein F8M41_023873 [Gigaspora margarita]
MNFIAMRLWKSSAIQSIEEQSEQILAPSRNDINEFITQKVVVKALKRYLSGANIEKLKKCETIDQLIKLTREIFKICFNAYNTKAIKDLDYLTINCKIPSKSGKNIDSIATYAKQY